MDVAAVPKLIAKAFSTQISKRYADHDLIAPKGAPPPRFTK